MLSTNILAQSYYRPLCCERFVGRAWLNAWNKGWLNGIYGNLKVLEGKGRVVRLAG